MRKVTTTHGLPLAPPPISVLLLLVLFSFQFPSISAAKTSQRQDVRTVQDYNNGFNNNLDSGLLKRQLGGFGFQHNGGFPPPPTSNSHYYHPSDQRRYDTVGSKSGHFSPNSIRNDYNGGNRDRNYHYDYPVSPSSAFTGRSSSGAGVGTYYNYNHNRRDDVYRDRDNYRDRQPYYDDYRYNNYPHYQRDREAEAAQQLENMMRTGQQRHAEYQKRIGQPDQESYDPFYAIGIRKNGIEAPNTLSGGDGMERRPSFPSPPSSPSSPTSPGSSNNLLSPSSTVSGSASMKTTDPNGPNSMPNPPSSPPAPAPHPLRNRRNSHQRLDDFYNNELTRDKYEIMNPKTVRDQNHGGNYHRHRHPHDHQRQHQQQPRWADPNFEKQFLTREQLTRRPDSRVPYPPDNRIFDRYSGSPLLTESGEPWSIRIGTQLKVNDDGRSPNPHRFYVRDEIQMGRNRSRFPGPIY